MNGIDAEQEQKIDGNRRAAPNYQAVKEMHPSFVMTAGSPIGGQVPDFITQVGMLRHSVAALD
jgi:hypothetical protein